MQLKRPLGQGCFSRLWVPHPPDCSSLPVPHQRPDSQPKPPPPLGKHLKLTHTPEQVATAALSLSSPHFKARSQLWLPGTQDHSGTCPPLQERELPVCLVPGDQTATTGHFPPRQGLGSDTAPVGLSSQ